ncbi:MAG: NTF2-like N-terminal transpeptidase domain-containing protein, partial [Solirubrobacteraceae bacterium]
MNESRNQRLHRVRPVLALAAVAFAVGAIIGAGRSTPPGYTLANQFVAAWTRRDFNKMYTEISNSSQRLTGAGEFTEVYREALSTATATRMRITGRPRALADAEVAVPVRVDTRLFGELSLEFTIKTVEDAGHGARVAWSRSVAFPGLRAGELLSRHTSLPRRATLLAGDGSVLAESPPGADPVGGAEAMRNSPLGAYAEAVLGTVGPAPASRRAALGEEGVPAEASVGLSGLELAYDDRLRGEPGGELLAGSRVLARAT